MTNPRILVVDDDEESRALVRVALEREGFSVLEAGDGAEALDVVTKESPDLVILDVNLPTMGGFDVLARLRLVHSVPVIMARVSAIDGRAVEQLAAQAEARRKKQEEEKPEDREGARRWALTREQRLTYMKELPADNRIVEGKLWSDPKRAEVSVEKEFADDLVLSKVDFGELEHKYVARYGPETGKTVAATIRDKAKELVANPKSLLEVGAELREVYSNSLMLREDDGHRFGEDLSDKDKQALIAFLATL